jgi:hypothetical protein
MKIFYLFLLLAKFALFDDSTNNYEDYINNLPGMQEMNKCMDAGRENIDQCTSTTFDNDYQCCELEIAYEDSEDSEDSEEDENIRYQHSCVALNGTIDLLKAFYEDKKYKALLKEINGFLRFGMYYIDLDNNGEKYYPKPKLSHNQTYKCKDGTYKISYGYEKYTENELKILDSDTHCLRYFYRYMDAINYQYDEEKEKILLKSVSNNECFNANLLQSSIDEEITCGYYEFKINYIDGTTDNFTTCYLHHENFYKNGEFDDQTKKEFQSLISQYSSKNGKISKSYITQFSDSKGNTYVFDSSTGKMESLNENSNSNSNSDSDSNGAFYKINFLILILFSIL